MIGFNSGNQRLSGCPPELERCWAFSTCLHEGKGKSGPFKARHSEFDSTSATYWMCNIGHIKLPKVKFPNRKDTTKCGGLVALMRGLSEIDDVKSM